MNPLLARLREERTAQVVLGLVAAYLVLYWVPGSPLPERMPTGVVMQGVIYGTSYALVKSITTVSVSFVNSVLRIVACAAAPVR